MILNLIYEWAVFETFAEISFCLIKLPQSFVGKPQPTLTILWYLLPDL